MTFSELEEAIAEAERFLKRAKELKKTWVEESKNNSYVYPPQAQNAAMKPSSLDLSKVLPRLRK